MEPATGLEPVTPALRGLVHRHYLRKCESLRFNISARKHTFFSFSHLIVSFFFHPIFTRFSVAGVKYLR